jgi:hypothetical protein
VQNAFYAFAKTKRQRKMRRQADGQAEPLCKFGPGGDFIAVWQPELVARSSKTDNTVDSAPATTIEDSGVLPREPMLFPDNSRIGSRIKHKPKYRVRTYRRAAKKRPAFRLSAAW